MLSLSYFYQQLEAPGRHQGARPNAPSACGRWKVAERPQAAHQMPGP